MHHSSCLFGGCARGSPEAWPEPRELEGRRRGRPTKSPAAHVDSLLKLPRAARRAPCILYSARARRGAGHTNSCPEYRRTRRAKHAEAADGRKATNTHGWSARDEIRPCRFRQIDRQAKGKASE